MKKSNTTIFFLTLIISLCVVTVALASDFCDGFIKGYQNGYKQVKKTSFNPMTPICPLKPEKGVGNQESDYEFGYNIGFSRGKAEGPDVK